MEIQKGSTSVIIQVKFVDTSGDPLTVAYDDAGLVGYFKRNTAAAPVAITFVNVTTLGTWVSGGIKAVSASLMPGVHEVHLPNAALANGAESVYLAIYGAASMEPFEDTIELKGEGSTSASGSVSSTLTVADVIARVRRQAADDVDIDGNGQQWNDRDIMENIADSLVYAISFRPSLLLDSTGALATLTYPTDIQDTLMVGREYAFLLASGAISIQLNRNSSDAQNFAAADRYERVFATGFGIPSRFPAKG